MGIEIDTFTAGWGVPAVVAAARRCDSCKTAAAAAFCKADAAFLCLNCDTKIHGTNRLVSRVWMCEVCEQAPAAVTCKADAAALCVTCDSDIHSANPLARRHERVPIQPFFDSADSIVKTSPFNSFLVPDAESPAGGGGFHHNQQQAAAIDEDDDMNEVSWLLPNLNSTSLNSKISNMDHEMKPGTDLFFNGMEDPFIDIHEFHHQQNHDSVVPEQRTKPLIQPPTTTIPVIAAGESCYDIDFCRSKLSSFNYPCQSISQSVSSSSLDVGIVPDANSLSDISYSFSRNMNNTNSDLISGTVSAGNGNQVAQMCPVDREARVLRYREKRKNRKFEKTIRYASRKAYAETRPRIKGRFAKRTEIDSDLDRLYNSAASAAYMADIQYGVVPTF